MSRHLAIFLLGIIILLSFSVRLYKLDSPIADWHSFRQADTSAVTRNFLKTDLDPLHPRSDDISNIQSGQDNPQRYRMVEFPIYNLLHYSTYQANLVTCSMLRVPCLTLESAGRLTTTLLSILSLVFLYGIVHYFSGPATALLAAAAFGFLPYNIYYSRVILPDPLMVTASLGATYFFIKALNSPLSRGVPIRQLADGGGVFFGVISVLLAAVALLVKPTAIFLLAPMTFLLFFHWKTPPSNWTLSILKRAVIGIIYALIAFTPLLLWRQWISQYPAGIPAYAWLLWQDIKPFQPAWFRWLFYERLTQLILGGFGLIPFILGIISQALPSEQQNKPLSKFLNLPISQAFYLVWLFSLLSYLAVVATGNVRHDYYQIILIPIICIYFAKGIVSMFTSSNFNTYLSIPASLFIILASLFFSWYDIRGYYQINNPVIIEAGQVADQILPPDAAVIAPYNGDTAFLYQTNRPGWPLVTHYPIQSMIDRGATHYISVTYDELTNQLMQEFPIVTQTEKFVILDLKIN